MSLTEDGPAVWLPKQAVEYEQVRRQGHGRYTNHEPQLIIVTLPQELAEEKELV